MIFKVKVCQMTGGSVGRERERENCGATFGDEIVEVEPLTLTFCVLWTLSEMET